MKREKTKEKANEKAKENAKRKAKREKKKERFFLYISRMSLIFLQEEPFKQG